MLKNMQKQFVEAEGRALKAGSATDSEAEVAFDELRVSSGVQDLDPQSDLPSQ